MQKARLLYLVDKYENELISSTRKYKSYYVGKIGNVVHKQNIRGMLAQMNIYMTSNLMMVLGFVLIENKLSLSRKMNHDLFYCRTLFR